MQLIKSAGTCAVFVPDHGFVFEADGAIAEMLERWIEFGDIQRVHHFLYAKGVHIDRAALEPCPETIKVRTISLAVAQKCNLGCTYCYARNDRRHVKAKNMSLDSARKIIDWFLGDLKAGETRTIAYMGGEPLMNRNVLRTTTEYAAAKAESAGARLHFSITTNGTRISADDVAFFNRFGFFVTISIDGVRERHDMLRPFRSGKGSYQRIVERVKLFSSQPHRVCRLAARVTVTPDNLFLKQTLDELVSLGFEGVMFSPVLKSPSGRAQMRDRNFDRLLHQMKTCGDECVKHIENNSVYPFMNLLNTLWRIHHYRRDDYPCSAGGGYLGVSPEGRLFACHRFVDDNEGLLGNVEDGLDNDRQKAWLIDRNVHTQNPCRECWARYMCGGGCHYESIYAGCPACNYIRGWLQYCLEIYLTVSKTNPSFLFKLLNNQCLDREERL